MKRSVFITFMTVLLALTVFAGFGGVVGAAPVYPQGTVASGNLRLNVRSGPGLAYPVIAKATDGAVYPLLARNSDSTWLQIQYGEVESQFGWVFAKYIRTDTALADLPMSAAESAAPTLQSPQSVTASAPAAPAHSTGGLIVFQESSGGAIYVMNADGSGLRFLTNGMDPVLSPDRSQVALGRWGLDSGLYLINIDGSNERKLTPGDRIKYPTWSPDGSHIVFNQQIGGGDVTIIYRPTGPIKLVDPDHWRLQIVNADGTGVQGISDQPRSFSPSWTSLGILYAVEGSIQRTAPGETTSILFDGNAPLRNPVLSPDGSTILVTRFFSGHWEVARMNADGSGLARLIPSKGSENSVSPAWSPDGSHILFLTDRAGDWQLWIMNADGSNPHAFAPDALADIHFEYNFVAEHVADWR